MLCKGGAKPNILDLFAHLQNKMHYLNDVQDLWDGKQLFVEFLSFKCLNMNFFLFLGTFQRTF